MTKFRSRTKIFERAVSKMMLSNVEKRKSGDVAWSTPSIIQFDKEMFLNLF